MDNIRNENRRAKLKAYNLALETWEKRKLLDVNSLPFDKVCADLIITNSIKNKTNEPMLATIFNNEESTNIALFLIPNQFDERNTQEQFIADFESFRYQFDALLLMNKDSNFTDFGFKEIISNDKNSSMTHYRNICFDFESFKNVFKSKSVVFMRTAIGSGSNRAMNVIQSTFVIPDFYSNQIVAIKHSIVCVTYGTDSYPKAEINSICKYSLNLIKRGDSLMHNTFEDLSLGKDIRVSAFISTTDTT
jgi:cell division protein FtsZ